GVFVRGGRPFLHLRTPSRWDDLVRRGQRKWSARGRRYRAAERAQSNRDARGLMLDFRAPVGQDFSRMAKRPHVLGVVLAGGEGKRLWPLTRDRAKPAVPFGANYRLIDFALSNLVNGRYLR